MNQIPIAKTLDIRTCGYDEVWLQDQIVTNPACLGLGDLEVVSRERRQASGGRLDILLKDPEDDSMYEVEIMLGETDETHIIRTIEYWDNEKRKWPQRQHHAVLVAESITRRFFNVIQLFSHAIPIVGIQANIIEAGGQRMLNFSKVIDTYEEPEETEAAADEVHDEAYWLDRSASTTDTAKCLLELVKPLYSDSQLKYVKNYISVQVNGYIHWWLQERSGNKSLVGIWLHQKHVAKARELLDQAGIGHTIKKNQEIRIVTDRENIEKKADVFREIAGLVKMSWEERNKTGRWD
jgi:hypothetical protein